MEPEPRMEWVCSVCKTQKEIALHNLLIDKERTETFVKLGVKYLIIKDTLRKFADVSSLFREGRVNVTNVADVEVSFLRLLDELQARLLEMNSEITSFLEFLGLGPTKINRMKTLISDIKNSVLGQIAEPSNLAEELWTWIDEKVGLVEKMLLPTIRTETEGRHLWVLDELDEELHKLRFEERSKDLLAAIESNDTAKVRQLESEGMVIDFLSTDLRFRWVVNDIDHTPLFVILCLANPTLASIFFECLVLLGYCSVAEPLLKETGVEVTERCFSFAVMKGHADILKVLLKWLERKIEEDHTDISEELSKFLSKWKDGRMGEKYIDDALKIGQKSIVNILFESGKSIQDRNVFMRCLRQTVEDGYLDCLQILLRWKKVEYRIEISELAELAELAAQKGRIALYRYLLIELNSSGSVDDLNLALTYKTSLPLSDTVDYLMSGNIYEKQQSLGEMIIDQRCLHSHEIPLLPGYGDVRRIPGAITRNCSDFVENIISESFLLKNIKKYQIHPMAVMRCGSSAEGTKVGLPDEMDYQILMEIDPDKRVMYEIEMESNVHGYKKVDLHSPEPGHIGHLLVANGGEMFHDIFIFLVMSQEKHKDKIKSPEQFVRIGGSATAEWTIQYQKVDENHCFDISVDRVPVLFIRNWPPPGKSREGPCKFITRTWLMDLKTLKEEGYALVAKPPHRNSEFAKKYLKETWRLQRMWRMSFGHLETMHLARLEQRVKDVYITCKSLRDPDLCRILFKDSRGMYIAMSKDLITSYMLKMVFMHNVEDFLHMQKSLVEMVYIVYSQLAQCIFEWFLPLYWNPTWNNLEGLKHDRKHTTEAAKIMEALATARFLRDGGADTVVLEVEDTHGGGVYPHLPSRSNASPQDIRLGKEENDVVVLIYSRDATQATCTCSCDLAYNVFQLG